MFKLSCGDVMPGCAATFESVDKGVLLQEVAGHAAADHGLTEITPEVFAAVDSRIVYSA